MSSVLFRGTQTLFKSQFLRLGSPAKSPSRATLPKIWSDDSGVALAKWFGRVTSFQNELTITCGASYAPWDVRAFSCTSFSQLDLDTRIPWNNFTRNTTLLKGEGGLGRRGSRIDKVSSMFISRCPISSFRWNNFKVKVIDSFPGDLKGGGIRSYEEECPNSDGSHNFLYLRTVHVPWVW